MWTSSTAEKSLKTINPERDSFSYQRILSTTAETLKRAINQNPEMALLISASIGVLLGCLIKRR
jgi:ElaB/YqjD/DUF883 family membrane-anchored ribosome-binding protein